MSWKSKRQTIWAIGVTLLVCLSGPALLPVDAKADPEALDHSISDLAEMSIEELMDVVVTSVSKKEERLFDAPAAVHTLNREDIRRSGATTIPELLRMVPGVHVGQMDANKSAISARGFSTRFANKLLVMVDGRSVYTPLFSGVFWEVQDMLLEDVERIEVVRGPGAALWGSNAVNGVINIITRSASDTKGTYVESGGGTLEPGLVSARFGDVLSERGSYRVYAKYFARSDMDNTLKLAPHDGWSNFRLGFRMDQEISARQNFMLQGDLYSGSANQIQATPILAPPFTAVVSDEVGFEGGHLVARWNFKNSATRNSTVQVSYDETRREELTFQEARRTLDTDFQQASRLGSRLGLVWGAGARVSSDKIVGSFLIDIGEERRTDHILSSFVQGDFDVVPGAFQMFLGTKLEHNSYSGFEVQPSLRGVWTANPHQSTWAAVSRAVRTPSRVEVGANLGNMVTPTPLGVPAFVVIQGNADFESEELIAWEIGHRYQPAAWLSLDLASFFNRYNNIRWGQLGAPTMQGTGADAYLLTPMRLNNSASGSTYGFEVSTHWGLRRGWRLKADYSFIREDFGLDPTVETSEAILGSTPRHKFHVRSIMDLPAKLELDTAAYFLTDATDLGLPGYTSVDLRLGWLPHPVLGFEVAAFNVLDDRHQETLSSLYEVPSEVYRYVRAMITVRH